MVPPETMSSALVPPEMLAPPAVLLPLEPGAPARIVPVGTVIVPSEPVALIVKCPPSTLVLPVYVLAPESVCVPRPSLVKLPTASGLVAVPSLIEPEKADELLLPPVVNVVATLKFASPNTTLLVPAPVLASEPILG